MSTSLKKQEAGQASYIVAQDWAETYADALTAFNADQLNRTLFASFATTHREDQPVLFEELCAVLISLIDRKVIVPEFSLRGLPEDQISEMREIASHAQAVTAAPVVSPTPAPTQAEIQARDIDQCASDWKTMSSAAFKSRWNGVRKPIFEATVAAGRI